MKDDIILGILLFVYFVLMAFMLLLMTIAPPGVVCVERQGWYYDAGGNTLFAVANSTGFIAMGGIKHRTVCDVWVTITPTPIL